MTQIVNSPNVLRDLDEMDARIAALERMTAAYGLYNFSVVAGYTQDFAFNPEATSLTEVARVLATFIDSIKPG